VPALFDAVAEGKLDLSGVLLLAPYLTAEMAGELIAAASHKTRDEIERLLAGRFPKPDVATRLDAVAPVIANDLLSADLGASGACQQAPGPVGMTAAAHAQHAPAPRARVTPLAAQRFALKVTIGQEAYELLCRAQDLLGQAVPTGDVGEVVLRALRVLVKELEKRKFAATDRPRTCPARHSADARHDPAAVQRAVWERDDGQCTFLSEKGHRCEARSRLEFDHVSPVARDGEATVENLRLRRRAHNQYAAERVFGRGFMEAKRQEARYRAAAARGPR
jgi:hypothetical protein